MLTIAPVHTPCRRPASAAAGRMNSSASSAVLNAAAFSGIDANSNATTPCAAASAITSSSNRSTRAGVRSNWISTPYASRNCVKSG